MVVLKSVGATTDGGRCPGAALTTLTSGVVALAALLSLVGCTPDSVTIRGHGYGHGRGMSQWGALGYAVDDGWSGTRILDHYFGGTSTGPVWPVVQQVYLTGTDGQALDVTQDQGRLQVDGYGGEARAVRVVRLSSTHVRTYVGQGCGGPWTLLGDRAASDVEVRSAVPAGDDPSLMVQHCTTTGTRYYRGSLRLVRTPGGVATVNQVDTEDLVRGIVPREVSPAWVDAGGGLGLNAVRAQALAARSYVAAGDSRWGSWATTCDSTSCQAYGGYGTRATGSGTLVRNEDPRTDQAVRDTASQVRYTATGRIAHTEFSSSSGGWTAGGTFPAVVDDGDDVAGNPHHSWTVTLGRADVEARFDAFAGRDLGTWTGFDGYSRDGHGDLGGRVLRVRARFSGGDLTVTGDQVRSILSLKSTWFAA